MPAWGVDPEATIATTRYGRSVWEWPTIVACGMLLGFVAAINFGSAPAFGGVSNQLHRMFAWRDKAEPDVRQALIVTADRRDQLTAVATLSPRGYYPLLARNRREVISQIRDHPGTLGLAVVDDTLAGLRFHRTCLERRPSQGQHHRPEGFSPVGRHRSHAAGPVGSFDIQTDGARKPSPTPEGDLLVAQRFERIDARRPARRQVSRGDRRHG